MQNRGGASDYKSGAKAKHYPGPLGAVGRTLFHNASNANGASNVDKWLGGGNYKQRPGSQLPGDIVAGAKVIGKAAISPITNLASMMAKKGKKKK